MTEDLWQVEAGDSPVIATAIHDGHALRPEVAARMAIRAAERRYEEDPWTGELARAAPTWVVVRRSRFEVDLNRPRSRAVYRGPDDAWGLRVWTDPPPEELVARSLQDYDAFYAMVRRLLNSRARGHGRFVVLDVHCYNHRRGGPAAPPADPAGNPEVNIGTGSLDHSRWGKVVNRFISDLSARGLDVRENVRFTGGHFSDWVDGHCGERGCCVAVDVKKIYMDEHTGQVDRPRLTELREALAAAVPGLVEELQG